jgi:hypothetical protein
MAHYYNVTKEEMAAYLEPQGFRLITLPGTVELVWARVVRIENNVPVSMRVYSGINPTGESRGVGADAMRVELYWKDSQDNIHRIGGSKRVHRVQGWKTNLEARLMDWQALLGPVCSRCGAPMILRQVKKPGPNNGKEFYSCANWKATNCNGFQWAGGEDLRPAA